MTMRLSLFAALLLAAPACAQVPSTQSSIAAAPGPGEALNARPALWVVKDDDTTIYLFGTVHVLKPGLSWYGGAVKSAFESAGELRLEIAEPDPAAMAQLLLKLAPAKTGTPPITARLTAAQKAKYIAQMEANGLPWAQLEALDAWFVTMNLAQAPLARLGYSPDSGVERMLTATAKRVGKPVAGLETPAEQLGFFEGLSDRAQIAFLNATVEELPNIESELGKLIAAWSAGRDRELAEALNESLMEAPELAEVLITRRNARWAEWIVERMKRPGAVFLAVGAGHLAGDGSVQANLARLGYKADRMATGR